MLLINLKMMDSLYMLLLWMEEIIRKYLILIYRLVGINTDAVYSVTAVKVTTK